MLFLKKSRQLFLSWYPSPVGLVCGDARACSGRKSRCQVLVGLHQSESRVGGRDQEGFRVTGIPVVFVSAMEGRGRVAVMHHVIETYEKWCFRLSTSRLNRWLRKVMSRHSWKDSATQPKVKYFTQVKARPPTFVAFMSGKTELSDTDIRFLTRSLKEDFNIGGIPIRILQRSIPRKASSFKSNIKKRGSSIKRMKTDKRTEVSDPTQS